MNINILMVPVPLIFAPTIPMVLLVPLPPTILEGVINLNPLKSWLINLNLFVPRNAMASTTQLRPLEPILPIILCFFSRCENGNAGGLLTFINRKYYFLKMLAPLMVIQFLNVAP